MSTISHPAPSAAATPPPSATGKRMLPPLKGRDFNRAGHLGSNVILALEALWANRLRSLLTTLLPFGVSAGIGIIFGLYPAVRAARLDPIEALRSL